MKMRGLHRLGAVALSLILCACDLDVGEGSAPTGIGISYGVVTDIVKTYECAAFQLAATATFEGNSTVEGDVTTRVIWSSSNPGVIDVSNGEIEAEPGSDTTFPAGTVIARSAGTATIRADYIGFSAEFGVTADPIAALEITPSLRYMTPGSQQAFKLEVVFADGDLPEDLTDAAIWRLPTADAPASLTAASTVQALSDPLDKSFVLEAQVFTCDRSASLNLALDQISALRLSYEQPADLPVPLGYTDQIRVEGVFADSQADPQNLSAQIEIEQVLGDADYATVSVGEYLTVNGQVADKATQFLIRYAPLDLEALTRSYVFSSTEIQSLRLSPDRGELLFPETLQLQAYGLFADGLERPVRRDLSWESLNPDLLSVTTVGDDAGEVTALGLKGDATVRAQTANSEGLVKADSDIRVLVD
ncbi:MAG: hypothetical protein M3O62_15470 [Pseudomonadota bacterium]|nr:hypothetical protein [Pseudomonadota bacterium]